MRKILTGILTIIVVSMFVLPASGGVLPKKNLFKMFEKKSEVKVYIADITDSTEEAPDVVPNLIRKALEHALEVRTTIYFRLVDSEKATDITISCDIKELVYTMKDEKRSIPVIGDILGKSNHARMRAVFTVASAGSGKILWQRDDVRGTVKGKNMTEEESLTMVSKRIVTVFMRECFSKRQRKEEYGVYSPFYRS